MNDLIKAGAALTMSSREIAELTGKEHKNVLADVRKMLEDLGQTSAAFSADAPDAYGRPQVVFNLPKRETLILVSGYSVELRARIIDRWQALEDGTPALPRTLPEALRLAADMAEQRAKAEAALALAAPKADALDRIATAEGSMCVRDAAKALQLRPIDLTRWLQAHGWVYRRQGNAQLLGYQDKVQTGYLEHKVTVVSRTDGTEKVVEQVRVTAKGLARLAVAIKEDLQLAA